MVINAAIRLKDIDLNLFVVFETIYEENNLTRAAELLHVTQPTVSNALTRLRRVYDDPLFIRAGRGVAPTPLARRLIGPVQQALKVLQASLDDLMAFDAWTSDRCFRISASDIVASQLLPELIKDLAQSAPGTSVQCIRIDRRDVSGALAAGDLDLAIDIAQLSGASLNSQPLFDGSYVCIMREGHPSQDRDLTIEHLLELDHIAVSSRTRGRSYLELMLSRMGRRIEPKLRVQNFLSAFEVVKRSDLVMITTQSFSEHAGIRVRELPFTQPTLGSSLYWHRNVEDDPANRWFRERVIDHCRVA